MHRSNRPTDGQRILAKPLGWFRAARLIGEPPDHARSGANQGAALRGYDIELRFNEGFAGMDLERACIKRLHR